MGSQIVNPPFVRMSWQLALNLMLVVSASGEMATGKCATHSVAACVAVTPSVTVCVAVALAFGCCL